MNVKSEFVVTRGGSGLQVVGLRKSYKRRPVIRDVTMHLDRGEVVALLGPNGSGKTTCFYAIAGLVSPEGGQVMIEGRDVTALPMYRRARMGIGYLPQEVSIFRGLSVEDNILAVLEITEKDPHTRRERLEELLGEFSIAHLRRTPALALSGGERRRVEIARCLAADPRYLLLDEPSQGSIRSRWARFAGWCTTSRAGVSASSSPTTMCGKRLRLWTEPTSCTTAPCSRAAPPKRWSATKR